jgi:SAM-dependent methyltransferase
VNDADVAQQIAAAGAYEDSLVPALFAEWAPIVVASASLEAGNHVLDVGCGTGVLAREAALRVGSSGSVSGVDANAGMLEVAARLSPGIEWRQGMAESLPFPNKSFDAVVSQFSLMFFQDRRKGLQEMMRVLRPHGRLAVAVWDSLDSIPAYAAEVDLLRRLAGDRAASALSAPFSLGGQDVLRSLAANAGLSSLSIATHKGAGRFPSIRSMVEPDLIGWLPVMGVTLEQRLISQILGEAERALKSFTRADGTVVFECSAHVITAGRD